MIENNSYDISRNKIHFSMVSDLVGHVEMLFQNAKNMNFSTQAFNT